MRNPRGDVLHVRKRGTSMLMLPGGKPEPGESFVAAAIREFREELGGSLNRTTLSPLGVFVTAAANEPGFEVEGHVFEHPEVPFDGPQAEIEQIEWVDPREASDRLAPLSLHILQRVNIQ